MIVLGIDPGASTGCAIYRAGVLVHLQTIQPHELDSYITEVRPAQVIFEDSRLQSHIWTPAKGAAALRIARNIGEIDAWCRLITAICERMSIPARGISPRDKGSKLTAQQFELMARWSGRSNQHERDAGVVAWRHRGAK